MKEQDGARAQRQHVVGEFGRRGAWAAGGSWMTGRWIVRERPAAAVPWMTISRPAVPPAVPGAVDPTLLPAAAAPTILVAEDHVHPGARKTIAVRDHALLAAVAGHPTGGVTTTLHRPGAIAPLPATTT